MLEFLDSKQKMQYDVFQDFVQLNIAPSAIEWDREQTLPSEIIKKCAEAGFLRGLVSEEFGGLGWDVLTYGMLNQIVGRKSTSLTGLFNVHFMVCMAIQNWGTEQQKTKWLPKLASGEKIGAFALTEQDAGSDINNIKTEFKEKGDSYLINGTKIWITFGAAADIYLVFGKCDNKPISCIVERDRAGVNITPIKEMMGFKSAFLAKIGFEDCMVPKSNLIGPVGGGLSIVAPFSLSFGRISVAFAGLGIIEECTTSIAKYARKRITFKNKLIDHGAVRKTMTEMGMSYETAKFLCVKASKSLENKERNFNEHVMMAKYYSTKMASMCSSHAIQLFGAVGCNDESGVPRLYRDAKILEVVEGSNPVLEMHLGRYFSIALNR